MNQKEQLTTKEGNRLIAEFVAMRIDSLHGEIWMVGYDGNEIWHNVHSEYWEFHNSWDWLMPACHKWDNLNMYDKDGYEYEYSILCDALDAKVSMYEIGPVWQQLVENIQWYNNQTPTK